MRCVFQVKDLGAEGVALWHKSGQTWCSSGIMKQIRVSRQTQFKPALQVMPPGGVTAAASIAVPLMSGSQGLPRVLYLGLVARSAVGTRSAYANPLRHCGLI